MKLMLALAIALLVAACQTTAPPVGDATVPVGPDAPDRPGSEVGAARWAVDHSVDEVRRRFGRTAVGYASVALSPHGSVPEEFRELAEHEL